MDRPLIELVRPAQTLKVYQAVHALYADLAQEIDARKPRCEASGRCCKFETYGHRLYVTTAELATFLTDQQAVARSPRPAFSLTMLKDMDGCPYQEGGLCSVHTLRPFGCRIYFCDPTAQDWMADAYERYHRRLRDLHGEVGVEYRYVEWRQALTELNLPG